MKDIVIPRYPHMLHGADYNPDQWQDRPDILREDMRLFQLANCNEMSLGIFAWGALEPEEGVFDFSFLDKAMDDVFAAGGRVILATPSGARPAWLAQNYPEVLREQENGTRNRFGGRHNHCYTSPVYREKVSIINRKLAERYKNHPALIAWHISNEYGGACHCALCREAFREWLKEKYQTLDNLNQQWWCTFWSHTYTDWNQIEPPSSLTDNVVHGRDVDWRRFVTARTADFMHHEVSAIREITPDIPVTANLMVFFEDLDYWTFAKEMDFVSWDCYMPWAGDTKTDVDVAVWGSLNHDIMRSLKQRPFLLMESTPSSTNWHPYNKLKRPGMLELSSLQAVAHGADSVQYFQWRKSRGSSEKFHGAVVDHAGHEHTRTFREVSALGARLKKLDEIVGTMPKSKVGLMHNWDNMWAINDVQGFSNVDKKYKETLTSFYRALWTRGIDTDIIGEETELSGYQVVIAPMLYMVSDVLQKKLCEFVKNGGRLLCTYMTGMVNENDLCHLGGFPSGELKEVFGIWNEEVDTLYPGEMNTVKMKDGTTVNAVDYCELIHAQGAQVLAWYETDFYKGMPAYTGNDYGTGKAYYVAFRDRGDFTDRVVGEVLKEAGVKSVFDGVLPLGVTAHSRRDGEHTYVFLQNYTYETMELCTAQNWNAVEDETSYCGTITLEPLQTLILRKCKI